MKRCGDKHGPGLDGKRQYFTRRTPRSYASHAQYSCAIYIYTISISKAGSTLRSSRAVPHPSTNRALRRLTSEVRRDPVHSTRYGRQRRCFPFKCNRTNALTSGPFGHLYWLARSKLRPCAGRVPGAHRARAGTALAPARA